MFTTLFEDSEIIGELTLSNDAQYSLVFEKKEEAFTLHAKKPTDMKSFKAFLKSYPELAKLMTTTGMDSIDKYRQNKKLTTRFVATNSVEKNFYNKVSKDLVSTGKYRLVKQKRTNGGYLYELERTSKD
jgi:hypothetical protein